jgi:hypothetical protein
MFSYNFGALIPRNGDDLIRLQLESAGLYFFASMLIHGLRRLRLDMIVHGVPDVTFTIPSPTNSACAGAFAGDTICLASQSDYLLGSFLASSGATILTGQSNLTAGLDNTIFEFTGTVTVTTGEQFQAGHDDGLQLEIGNILVINAPGPTAFTTTPATYTGPSGTFSFDLVYAECCGPPAYLGIALPFESIITPPPPAPTPEPTGLAILASGLIGLGVADKYRQRAFVRA